MTGLSSAYYGGETGTGTIDSTARVSAGGEVDSDAVLRVVAVDEIHLATGTAAPTDATAEIAFEYQPHYLFLPAGESLYIKRVGGSNVRASVAMWLV